MLYTVRDIDAPSVPCTYSTSPVPVPARHFPTHSRCFQISTESETNLGSNLKRVSLSSAADRPVGGGGSRSEYKMERVDIMHEGSEGGRDRAEMGDAR